MPTHKYTRLDLSSVKSSEDKLVPYLTATLGKQNPYSKLVIFLGEAHNSKVDQNTARRVLGRLPLWPANATVILERGLEDVYEPHVPPGVGIGRENSPEGDSMQARNERLARMIIDKFEGAAKVAVYVACGSEHGPAVFKILDRRYHGDFTFIFKPSVV